MESEKTSKQPLVYKANELVEAKYRLSVLEQKLLVVLISKINPDKPDFENPYRMTMSEVAKALNISRSGSQYAEVAGAMDKLMVRLVKIYEDETTTVTHWINDARYYVGKGYFDVWFGERLRKYVLQLNNFLKYSSNNIYQLRSTYSIRIYEMLKNWETKGVKVWSVETLRDRLGIRENEYVKYSDFKKRVIEKAKSELKETTDISFDYFEVKLSRKVVELKFFIEKNTPSGAKPKKKRGRPKKNTQDPKQLMLFGSSAPDSIFTPNVYSEDLDAKLKAYGIQHLDKYKKEGISEQDWGAAETNVPNKEAPFLITSARMAKTMREGNECKTKLDAQQEVLKSEHRNYAPENMHRVKDNCSFDLSDDRMVRVIIKNPENPRDTSSTNAVYGSADFYQKIKRYLR
jgi:hypothetical protein